jgi:hypothetical protein
LKDEKERAEKLRHEYNDLEITLKDENKCL